MIREPGRSSGWERVAGASGFTLVESLMVIVILVVLAGLIVPVFGRTHSKAEGVACMSNMRQIQLNGLVETFNRAGRMGGQADEKDDPPSEDLPREERIRKLFEEHKQLTRADVIQIVECDPDTATKDLEKLVEEGFVKRVNPNSDVKDSCFILAAFEE